VRSTLLAEKARAERRASSKRSSLSPLPLTAVTGALPEVPFRGLWGDCLAHLPRGAPVLALEIGSAFAGLLAGVSHAPGPVQTLAQEPPLDQRLTRLMSHAPDPVQSRPRARQRATKALPAVLLALQSGELRGSQREIAEVLGTSKSTVARAQRMLAC
jgi:hypothetical protein